jgi:MoaA/NifB/PqqE/SkfB family radical SAM enzyme
VNIPFKLGSAAWRAARAFCDPAVPLLTQVVVTRRCNLACGYCTEYDHVSSPVETARLEAWIDRLSDLGTLIVTFTGGESLLHPELDRLVRRVNDRGMVCTIITNGYPVTRRWIERLNDAGLTLLQVSVDNIEQSEYSQKSWNHLRPRMELLREHARFRVNVNAVLGACAPEEVRRLVREVKELGFFMTFGLLHDNEGQIRSGLLGDELADFFREVRQNRHLSALHNIGEGWEDEMIRKGSSPWRCRAGARFLYIDEEGLVSYCSQMRGHPGIPITSYTRDHLRAAFYTAKGCEDGCTINCVRRASSLDNWRSQKPPSPKHHPSPALTGIGTFSAEVPRQES